MSPHAAAEIKSTDFSPRNAVGTASMARSGGSLYDGGHGSPMGTLTDIGNMLKAFIGLNFMYVSYAFSKAGLIRGIIGLIVIAAVTEHCCLLLVKVKNAMPAPSASDNSSLSHSSPTYADIARFAGGSAMEAFVNIALVVTQIGYCVGYLIFISHTIHDLLQFDFPIWPLVLITLPPLLGLALLRSIRSLGPFSMVANIALLAGFAAVASYITKHFKWNPPSPSIFVFPLFFGQMTAALEGIGLVIPVETSMPNRARFPMVLRIALIMLVSVLMTVGVLGAATFGDQTRSIILLNFGTSPIVSAVKIVLIVGILFTYPLQLVPVIHAAERWILGDQTGDSRSLSQSELVSLEDGVDLTVSPSSFMSDADHKAACRGEIDMNATPMPPTDPDSNASGRFVSNPVAIVIRAMIVAATGVTAILAGASFGLFQSLVGSLGASSLAYTAPALFHVRVFRDELTPLQRAKDWVIFAFGVLGMIIGTATTILEFSKLHSSAAMSP